MTALVQDRLAAYTFFTELLTVLPDEQFVRTVLSEEFVGDFREDPGAAGEAFIRFQQDAKTKSEADVLQDLGIDRALLLRGVNVNVIKPPYESLYTSAKSEEACLSVVQMYKKAGLAISETVKEPAEYLGCELGFMAELCREELAAIDAANPIEVERCHGLQVSFFRAHLGAWVEQFAQATVSCAKTDFYRGVGYLLSDFMAEEKLSLSD